MRAGLLRFVGFPLGLPYKNTKKEKLDASGSLSAQAFQVAQTPQANDLGSLYNSFEEDWLLINMSSRGSYIMGAMNAADPMEVSHRGCSGRGNIAPHHHERSGLTMTRGLRFGFVRKKAANTGAIKPKRRGQNKGLIGAISAHRLFVNSGNIN